jgi:hypothetical protein
MKHDVAEAALGFLIEYAAKHRGTIKELTARMNQHAGTRTIYRQQVESWLAPDPKARVEPKLAIGLLLIAEGLRMIEGKAGWINLERICALKPQGKRS